MKALLSRLEELMSTARSTCTSSLLFDGKALLPGSASEEMLGIKEIGYSSIRKVRLGAASKCRGRFENALPGIK